MTVKEDKQHILIYDSNHDYRRKTKNRNMFLFTATMCVVVFFCSIFMGFWFVNWHSSFAHGLNIIIVSGNTSVIIDPFKIVTIPETKTPTCSAIADLSKFDCYPNAPVTVQQCTDLGCCYQEVLRETRKLDRSYFPPLGTPYCFYPRDYLGYRLKNIAQSDSLKITAQLERVMPSPFPKDIPLLNLDITVVDENTVRIKIIDANNARHEATLYQGIVEKSIAKDSQQFTIQLMSNGTLVVQRKSTGAIIFQTNLQQLVYADQFLQLSTLLATPFIYGLGEKYDPLLKNVNWTRTTQFNRDNWPRADVSLYGSHPFYVALEKDSNSHGVFLLNKNSMDVILQPTPALTFRPIGGILDLFIFLGPSPSDVVQQYTNIVSNSFMPPYWSLGFHLCRYDYNSLNETRKVWQRTRDAGIPFDTQWNDIDYMKNHNDFTYDSINYKGLPEFVKELHSVGMRYIPIIDPGISNAEKPGTYPPFDDGIKMDIFVKNNTGQLFIGKVWNPVSTVFPDFSHPNIFGYWTKQLKSYHDIVPFDGAWIDMNEPANFYDGQKDGCPNTPLDDPPYVPGGLEPMRTHTICMSAKHYNTSHYDEHNVYAYKEAVITYLALLSITQKRPFIISRASSSGQGVVSGHWSGDIGSTWEDMRYSVYDLLKFNLYGMPMMGSDICGFRDNTTVELCARWSALGAFYPFSRNHNDRLQRDQDPVALGDDVVNAARNTLTTRYNLLPYLYYLFYRSHVYGETVARPLFFEFVQDRETYSIEEQFLWGSALMIMPALYPGITTINAYFPEGIWYNYYTGGKMNVSKKTVTLDAPLDSINLALRAGYIIPHQHSNTTTTESRKNKFYLLAGLDENNKAMGEIYWDDGESIVSYEKEQYNLIMLEIQQNTFTAGCVHCGYNSPMLLDYVKVCSLTSAPTVVQLNGKTTPFEFDEHKCLCVTANVSLLQDIVITWQ